MSQESRTGRIGAGGLSGEISVASETGEFLDDGSGEEEDKKMKKKGTKKKEKENERNWISW